MRIFSNSLILVVILALLWGCEIGTPPVVGDCANPLDLEELKSTWILEEIIDKETNESVPFPEEKSAEFTFQGEGCVAVKGTCNKGQGKYEVSENELTIVKIGLTKQYCIDFDERIITRNLSGIYCISGDKLTIISNSDKDLIFKKADHMQSFECVDF